MASMTTPSQATVAVPIVDQESAEQWYRVCALDELRVAGAKCSDVAGRPIVLFRTATGPATRKLKAPAVTVAVHDGPTAAAPAEAAPSSSPSAVAALGPFECSLADGSHLWAMDRVCYHMGGPLDQGDIEEVGGALVVSCPWHRYKIGLEDGGGLYQSAPGAWKSKGRRQRTHEVRVDAATGDVQVRLDQTTPEEVASDNYNDPDRYAALQARLARTQQFSFNSQQQPQARPEPLGPPGQYLRSGHVFAANRAAAADAKAKANSNSS